MKVNANNHGTGLNHYGDFDNVILEPTTHLTCTTLADAVRFVPSAFRETGGMGSSSLRRTSGPCLYLQRLPILIRNTAQ